MAHRHHPSVPTTRDVIPGAGVNIVLKQDQPTGRTVSGVVRDVLTRGNHPRGIKVRLADGRVGRVQSFASGDAAATGEELTNGEVGEIGAPASGGEDVGEFHGRRIDRSRIGRGREEDEVPSQQIGLDAYIKPAKQRGKRKGVGSGRSVGQASSDSVGAQQGATARCPVCDDFEGDEAAVAHHVAGHFEE